VCGPPEERYYTFSYGVDEAKNRCTPQDSCKIGWLSRDIGRQAWEAWLDLRAGEGTTAGVSGLRRLKRGLRQPTCALVLLR
jgi:hypothetical protein